MNLPLHSDQSVPERNLKMVNIILPFSIHHDNRSQKISDAINKIVTMFELTQNEIESLTQYMYKTGDVMSIAFCWSIVNGKTFIANYLLETHHVKLTGFNSYYLMLAVENRQAEIIELLIKYDININVSNGAALTKAVENNFLDIVKLLIQNGANVALNRCAAIKKSIENKHIDIINYLIENNVVNCYNNYIMYTAAQVGNLEVVRNMIEKGANVNYDNDSILIKSIENNHIDVVNFVAETYVEKDIRIPDKIIISNINNTNQYLIAYVSEDQYELFDPELVKCLIKCKSARKI